MKGVEFFRPISRSERVGVDKNSSETGRVVNL